MKSLLKKTISGTLLVLTSIVITGCGGTPSPTITQLVKKQDISVNMKIKGLTADDSIMSVEIDREIEQRMYGLSKVNRFARYRSSGGTKGLVINQKNDNFNVYYKTGLPKVDTFAFKKYIIRKNYVETADNLKVTLGYPMSYETQENSFGMNFAFDLSQYDNSTEDIDAIYTQVLAKPFSVKRMITKEGEINSDYKAESIYANFTRKLGIYDWTRFNSNIDIDVLNKENTFSLKFANKIVPVKVSVYPYKNGSKVVYKVFVNYIIDTKNGPNIKMKDINAIHDIISKIVND